MDNLVNKALDAVKKNMDSTCDIVNVGPSERILSVVAGGFILGIGVKKLFKSPISAFSGIAVGGGLIFRGVTGYCKLKDAVEGNDGPEKATVVEHRYFVK